MSGTGTSTKSSRPEWRQSEYRTIAYCCGATRRLDSSKSAGNFYTRRIVRLKEVIVETGEDLQAEEVAFEGDFEDAVKFANSEMVRYGSIKTFGVCEHKPPNINHFCPNAAGMFPDQLQGVTWRMRKFRRRPWYRLIRRLL